MKSSTFFLRNLCSVCLKNQNFSQRHKNFSSILLFLCYFVTVKSLQKLLPDNNFTSTSFNLPNDLMEKDNTLLIIEEHENGTKTQEKEENPAAKLKLALASKKLKEDFFKENEINKTAEIISDDFENEIDQSILEMEQSIGLTYDSDNDEPPNGNLTKRRGTLSSTEDSNEDEATVSAKNSKLIESSVLQRRLYDDYQQSTSVMLPFYERRRLSECKEESESEEEPEAVVAAPPKKRFTVTKAQEEPVTTPIKQPVSILKKTPSPPSNPKVLITHSPKKIRYEAAALKDVSAQKNSQTIHFPCSPEKTNIKSIFSPQGLLNPHLDKRYFDTSLVEVRASQTLTDSSKSLNDKGSRQLDDNVWIKRKEGDVSVSKNIFKKNNGSVSFQESLKSQNHQTLQIFNFCQSNFYKCSFLIIQDGTDGSSTSSVRPQSAPASQHYKKSKKQDKEAKLKEKERLKVEKDALKIKKEAVKKMEKEAARLEKLSKSNERLGGRSGSLERRKSGEESVTNQFTIHGEKS